uniref:Calmodulin n=1 Tax=Ditylum brightwellii TaxID=49249 RepID=A0A7S1VXM4_9STRA
MMYERKNRDPLQYYRILEVVGVGSMGSVSRVQKRPSAIGGSARLENSLRGRKQLQEWKEYQQRQCLQQQAWWQKPLPTLFSSCCDDTSSSDWKNHKWLSFFRRTDITTPPTSSDMHNLLSLPTLEDGPITNFPSHFNLNASQHSILNDTFHSTTNLNASFHSTSSAIQNIEYALKSIHIQRLSKKAAITELQNEIEILKTLDHAHIVKPIETFEHHQQIFLVMEMCRGGDLYSRDPYTEEESARIVNSVLSAISYMHKRGVVHRDLKFENIMFVSDHPQSEVKLIDFGLSAKYGPEDPVMSDGVGTIYTMAPEVLKGKYTSQADIWSIGVLAYMLLSSQVPFFGTKRREIAAKIRKCKYDFKGKRWANISAQAKNFVSELLQLNPDQRPTASEASKSSWLNRRCNVSVRFPDDDQLDNIQTSLQNFAAYSKLKKLALMVIAHKSTSEEIGFLRKAFEQYDEDHDGFIELNDFRDALQSYGYCEEDIMDMFHGADIDSTGSIKYTEFLAATIEAHGAINEERLAEAFDRLDTDDSGFITAENLRELLGDDLPLTEIQSIITECGLTNDQQISYEEFLGLFDQYQEDQREEALQQIKHQRSMLDGSSHSIICNLDLDSIDSEN